MSNVQLKHRILITMTLSQEINICNQVALQDSFYQQSTFTQLHLLVGISFVLNQVKYHQARGNPILVNPKQIQPYQPKTNILIKLSTSCYYPFPFPLRSQGQIYFPNTYQQYNIQLSKTKIIYFANIKLYTNRTDNPSKKNVFTRPIHNQHVAMCKLQCPPKFN